MATKQTIVTQLTQIATTLRHRLTAEELETLVSTWGEIFQDVSDQELISACKLILRSCRFFPVPADVQIVLDETRRRPLPNKPALPPGKQGKVALWVAVVSGQVCCRASMDARLKDAANRYFDSGPGMSSQREQMARDILGSEFVEFEKWEEAARPGVSDTKGIENEILKEKRLA